jgi:hypothetical protein
MKSDSVGVTPSVDICAQETLFDYAASKLTALPPGFRYRADFLSEAEETDLAAALGTLPLKPFEFHGHIGNRRVVSFGSLLRLQPSGSPGSWRATSLSGQSSRKGCAIRWTRNSRIQTDQY